LNANVAFEVPQVSAIAKSGKKRSNGVNERQEGNEWREDVSFSSI